MREKTDCRKSSNMLLISFGNKQVRNFGKLLVLDLEVADLDIQFRLHFLQDRAGEHDIAAVSIAWCFCCLGFFLLDFG